MKAFFFTEDGAAVELNPDPQRERSEIYRGLSIDIQGRVHYDVVIRRRSVVRIGIVPCAVYLAPLERFNEKHADAILRLYPVVITR